jgi:putative hemolysin
MLFFDLLPLLIGDFGATSLFLVLFCFLIFCSGMISGSEVAYFSLTPSNILALEEEESEISKVILAHLKREEYLLATILISNNFVNIAIVIVGQIIINTFISPDSIAGLVGFLDNYVFGGVISIELLTQIFTFIITTVLVTSLLLLLGEIFPKIYARINKEFFLRFMAVPLTILGIVFYPFSSVLVRWSNRIESKISSNKNAQTATLKEDLDAAINLTVKKGNSVTGEAEILKGIVNFGDMAAKQIMKSRLDVVALEITQDFSEVLKVVRDSGYSRIPVYEEDLDRIKGILYVKDLLGHTSEAKDFNWQSLIRDKVLYVPETKKIDDILAEIQSKRNHMAFVVNEFGGTIGLITLEDIMEEVIGDIKDEFDEEVEIEYIKLDDNNYIFQAKTMLNDICKIIGEKSNYFDDHRQQADSIGGLIVEILGMIPKAEKEVTINNITLTVIEASERRIEKINLKINQEDEDA